MLNKHLNILVLTVISILGVLLYSTNKQPTVISNHGELKVVNISEFSNVSSKYIAPSFKLAKEAGFNMDLIHIESIKFKDVKKPVLEGYIKATDYLTKEQVVETSDLHNPDAIVYILQSESSKIKKRGYLWCTKQIIMKSDDLDYYADGFEDGEDDKVHKKYLEELTNTGFVNINTFVNKPNLIGLSKTKNGFNSAAIKLITAGRLVDMYTFSCEKENQLKIEQELIQWAELIVEANQ